MLKSLSLISGPSPGLDGLDVDLSPVTVFVGPNNSGKSAALQEIANACRTGNNGGHKVCRDVTFAPISEAEAQAYVATVVSQPAPGEVVAPGYMVIQSPNSRAHVSRDDLMAALQNPNNPNWRYQISQWILGHKTTILDGPTRINLISQQPAGDLVVAATSSLQTLFRDNAKRMEVQRIIKDALGINFVIDPTSLGWLRIRFSASPQTDGLERSLSDEAIAFMKDATPVEVFSDGVKAFTGMVTEMVAGQPRVLLIDEPEAFLHPALARRLGTEVARAAKAENRHVFVSTHSGAFLMGCIQSGAPVTIVRLTYRNGIATSRVLTNEDLIPLMRDPLLRSAGVMDALFFEHVIVTEGDADRAFYQEVNERLLRARDPRGIPNCLFLHAQNKQTLKTIVAPLRNLGIPVAAIADIDMVKEGGAVWSGLMNAASMPPMNSKSLGQMRADICKCLLATGRDMKRDGGIYLLKGQELETAEQFVAQLGTYGVFAVAGGEVESWLKQLSATGHGPGWLVEMFEAMGSDPEHDAYVHPTENDVWAFMGTVSQWLLRPDRKGIPHA